MNIPNHVIEHLNLIIGRLKISTYDEFEVIKTKKELLRLAFKDYVDAVNIKDEEIERQKESERLWSLDSTLSKQEFAWLTKTELKNILTNNSLTFDEIEVLQSWALKD